MTGGWRSTYHTDGIVKEDVVAAVDIGDLVGAPDEGRRDVRAEVGGQIELIRHGDTGRGHRDGHEGIVSRGQEENLFCKKQIPYLPN